MKVLFVSNDPTIFDEMSPARWRMRAYALEVEELHIVSLSGRGAVERQEGGLFLHPVHAWKIFKIQALAARAHQIILKEGIEVVSSQDPFEHGLAALRAVSGTNARLHVQVHTDFLSPWFTKGGIRRGASRATLLNRHRCTIADRVLPKANGIRVVSQRIKTSLVARYGSRIPEPVVIPVPVDMNVPKPVELPAHHFTFALITVGRLEPEKHIEDILVALKFVTVRYPRVGLFIAGEGRMREELEKKVRSIGLSEHVVFLGNRPDVRALMSSANAFVQASAYEGYGRTLIEAALAKVPIITTDVGVVGEVFKDKDDVLVAPVADRAALAKCITTVIEDNALRKRLSSHADATVRAHLATVDNLPARLAADLTSTAERNFHSLGAG